MSDPLDPVRTPDPEASNVAKQALLEPGIEIDVDSVDIAVYAAGGVVWRRDDRGEVEVVLIHRPRYDDWSFPKGKRDSGETDKECAVREIFEETNFVVALGDELLTTGYIDRKGRPKQVRYWSATVADQLPFEPGDEVDEVVWVPLAEAKARLSYARDLPVLKAFRAQLNGG